MKVPRLEEPSPTGWVIRRSAWGWTAHHPSGRAVAHSTSKPLLEAYVKEST